MTTHKSVCVYCIRLPFHEQEMKLWWECVSS